MLWEQQFFGERTEETYAYNFQDLYPSSAILARNAQLDAEEARRGAVRHELVRHSKYDGVRGLSGVNKWIEIGKILLFGDPNPPEGLIKLSVADNPISWFVGGGGAFKAVNSGAKLSTNGARLSQHLSQLEKYGAAGFKELANGRFRYYGSIRQATNVGEMRGARLVREWNPFTGNKRTWYETLDNAGRIRQVHPKYNNLPHYKFGVNGNYIGKW